MSEGVAITFIIVGLPVLGALAYAAFETYLKHKQKSGGKGLEKRVAELERRVEVLEMIVTSADYPLRQKLRCLLEPEGAQQKKLPSHRPSVNEPTAPEL